jgi:hypothetical protein
LALRLCELHLKGAWINLCEKISFVNELTFLKGDADELTVDAATNRDGVEGGDRPKTVEIDGQVAALSGGNNHGHNKVAHTRTAPAPACRPRHGRICGLAGWA